MPDERMEIVVAAHNNASGALKEVQHDLAGMGKAAAAGASDIRAQQRRILEEALGTRTDLSRRTRSLMQETLRHLGGGAIAPDIKRQIEAQLGGLTGALAGAAPGADRAIRRQATDLLRTIRSTSQQAAISWTGATRQVNVLGAGILTLRGPLAMVTGLFATLGQIGVTAIGALVRGIVSLAQTILTAALTAIRRFMIGLTALGAVMIGALAILAKVGFGYNAFIEEQKLSLEVMLRSKEAAAALFAWLKKFADITPFRTDETIEAGKALLAYGLEVKRYLPLAGNLAAAMNKPLEQAINLLGKAKAGMFDIAEFAPLGVTREKLVSVGVKFQKSGEPIDRSQMLAGVEKVIERDFPNMMGRLANSWKGIWSTIASYAQEAAGDLTAGAFEVVRRGALRLRDSWDELRKSDAWQSIKDRLGGALALVANWIMNLIQRAPELADRLAKMLSKAPIEDFLSAAIGLANFMHNTLAKVVQGVAAIMASSLRKSGIDSHNIWATVAGYIAKAIGALGAGILQFAQLWPQVFNWIRVVIADWAQRVIQYVDPVINVFRALGDTISTFDALFSWLIGKIDVAVTASLGLIKRFGTPYHIAVTMTHPLRELKEFRGEMEQALKTNRELGQRAGALWQGGYAELYRRARRGPAEKAYEEYIARPDYNVKRAIELQKAMLAERQKAGLAPGQTINPIDAFKQTWQAMVRGWQQAKIELPEIKLPEPIKPEQIQDSAYQGTKDGAKEGVEAATDNFVTKVWGATADMLKRAGVSPMWLASIGVRTEGAAKGAAAALGQAKGPQQQTELGLIPRLNLLVSDALARLVGGAAGQPVGAAQPRPLIDQVTGAIKQAAADVLRSIPLAPKAIVNPEAMGGGWARTPTVAGPQQPLPLTPVFATPAGPPVIVDFGGLHINVQGDIATALQSPNAKRDLERFLETALGDWLRRYR